MIKKILMLLAALLFLVSCSQDMLQEKDVENSQKRNDFVSAENARLRLIRILGQIEPTTRSQAALLVGDCTPLTKEGKPLTRSSEEQPACYTFRINNNTGFAIMSASDKLPELLAIGQGTPNFKDSTANLPDPNLWIVPDTGINVEDYDLVRREPTYVKLPNKAGVTDPRIKPKWSQHNEINKYLPIVRDETSRNEKDSTRAATGCVAMAMAMIFSHPNYQPTNYQGYTFDWDRINAAWSRPLLRADTVAMNQVAKLMLLLGNEENLDLKYRWASPTTWASDYDVPHTFQNFGFTPGIYQEYSLNAVLDEINQGYPVYMSAVDEEHNSGHAFVVHGAMMCITPVDVYSHTTGQLINSYYEYSYYLQINWGWTGKSDGYFLEGNFNSDAGPDIWETENPPELAKNHCNFVDNFHIITNVRKK